MGRKRKVEEEEEKVLKREKEEEEVDVAKGKGGSSKKKKKSKDKEAVVEEPPSPPKKSKTPRKSSCKVLKTEMNEESEATQVAKKGVSPTKPTKLKSLPIPKEEEENEGEEEGNDGNEEEEEEVVVPPDVDPENLPPVDVLYKLLERMESHLPKEDKVKYDSQVRKLDWEKIAFEGLSASQCQMTWMYIQERIRRFRVLSEMIPDAREWIQHPWTNFYKSRTFNRHPDMPKKPLSVYMFYYSQQMNKILKKNSELSMPEVAKICSEQYAQLSEEKKLKYREKCDEMKLEYNKKLEDFYKFHPEMAPSAKGKKAKPPQPIHSEQVNIQHPQQTQPQSTYVMTSQPVLTIPTAPMTSTPNNIVYDPKYLPKYDRPIYPGAPERPFKPFDLFFKKELETCGSDPSFDRQVFAQKCRKEWKEMKCKKKAKWIKTAFENYRKYEAELREFMEQNPGYVPPTTTHKNFLTIEDQKILDRSMGRPEKPSSSAYSLFSKEMLNNNDIKKYPSKERMAHISELWKTLPETKKESYQSEVNEAMGIYRQMYEDWFNGLNDDERKAESDRNNSKSIERQQIQAPNQYITLQTQPQMTNVALPTAPVMHAANAPQTPLIMVPKQVDMFDVIKDDILKREPIEPAKSRKQLFIAEWLLSHKKKRVSDAKKVWRSMGKKEKRKAQAKLDPQRQKYIDDYTVFVRGLSKQELEIYTELKQKRDEEEEARLDSDESDSSDSELSSESD
nr:nucleolar transcription factor 1-A-like [Lepeophtheirus salmonis]